MKAFSPWIRRAAFHVAALSAYGILALALTYPVVRHPFSAIPIAQQIPGWRPGDGDPWQTLWAIWLVGDGVRAGRIPLFTDRVFYPLGVDLWYAPATLPIVLPALVLLEAFGLVLAYNAMVIGCLAVAGYATFLLVHRITGHPTAAFLGGLVFAFSPYHLAHAAEHLFFLGSASFLPLYVLYLLRGLDKDGGVWNVIAAALVLAVTTVANIYYATFLALFTVLIVAATLQTATDHRARRRVFSRFACLFAVGVVLLVPYVAFVVPRIAVDTEPRPSLAEVNQWSADLIAFLTPSPMHPWWGAVVAPLYAQFTGNLFEQIVYLGAVALILAGVAVARHRKARLWMWIGAVFTILALGPMLHVAGQWTFAVGDRSMTVPLPAMLLHLLPGVSALKVWSRSAAMVMLVMAVLVGLGVTVVRDHLRGRGVRPAMVHMVAMGCALAVVVDYLSIPLPVQGSGIPRTLRALGTETGSRGSLLDVPLDWRVAKYQYYQTAHRKPLLVGLLPRPTPAVFLQLDGVPFMSLFAHPTDLKRARPAQWDRRTALRVMDLFNLDTIVIHGEYLDPEAVAQIRTVVTEYFPVDGVVEDERLTVIRLRRDQDTAAVWSPDAYEFDFGPDKPRFFIAKGWWPSEQSGPVGFAWSMGRVSTLGFYLPQPSALSMSLEVTGVPASTARPQRMTVMLNDQALGRVEVGHRWEWTSHSFRVPRTATRPGINAIRFVHDHVSVPRNLMPESRDSRELGVAFRRILLRQE